MFSLKVLKGASDAEVGAALIAGGQKSVVSTSGSAHRKPGPVSFLTDFCSVACALMSDQVENAS